jgi:hypothetical protein
VLKCWKSSWKPSKNHFFGWCKDRIHRQFDKLFVLKSRPTDRLENVVSVLASQEYGI